MTVELPKLMRTLPRDRRGLPVPFIVLFKDGTPMFAINDSRKVKDCVVKKLCSICGKRLDIPWFISGSRAFLHPFGGFVDSPVHLECAEYALQVCPFLAARNWRHSVGERQSQKLPEVITASIVHVGPRKPEWFGLGQAASYTSRPVDGEQYRHTVQGWLYIEFWREGHPCNAPSSAEVTALMKID